MIDVKKLAEQAGMNVSLWDYGAGSMVFSMGIEGLARGAVERFAVSLLEAAAARAESEDVASTDDPLGVQSCIVDAIRAMKPKATP